MAEGHGHSHSSDGGMAMAGSMALNASHFMSPEPSYFTHPEHTGLLMAHIVLMTLAWVFLLPLCVMLGIAKSRFSLVLQLVFLVMNVAGVLIGTVYNTSTPDLYPNNAHHKIGWIATWIVMAQFFLSMLGAYSNRTVKQPQQQQQIVDPPKPQFKREEDWRSSDYYRYSRDSGQGTEPSSPGSSNLSQARTPEDEAYRELHIAEAADTQEGETHGLLGDNSVDRFFMRKITSYLPRRVVKIATTTRDVIDRLILILAFVALCTGVVTYGGHFKGNGIFSGLAHFIKGGIFFWYGLLVLGRAMGSFADLGWSWNLKPDANVVGRRKAAAPSAEFVESLLIFIYGSTNVFLEHLGSEDGAWSAGDLEHVSISVMFFGGGLCGMLLESPTVREYLNSALTSAPRSGGLGPSLDAWKSPRTYGFSINPLPAIIIMLLGMMMSSHHQASMVSTMLHAQWGGLFTVAALARGVSYLLIYLSPPTSYLPSRPPSELVVAFCLISGGLIFMGSNSDFVEGMERYELNAMFSFTVTMGITAFLMAWEIVVLAVKGWAVRHEQIRLVTTTAA